MTLGMVVILQIQHQKDDTRNKELISRTSLKFKTMPNELEDKPQTGREYLQDI